MTLYIYIDDQETYRVTETKPVSFVAEFEHTAGDIVFEAIFALVSSGICTDGIELSV